MKLFQSICRFHQLMGIYSLKSNQTYSFNWKIAMYYLTMVLTLTSLVAFMQFQAQSEMDVGNCFYGLLTQSGLCWYFSATIREMPNILKYIEDSNGLIEKSKWNLQLKWYQYNDKKNGGGIEMIVFQITKNRVEKWVKNFSRVLRFNR